MTLEPNSDSRIRLQFAYQFMKLAMNIAAGRYPCIYQFFERLLLIAQAEGIIALQEIDGVWKSAYSLMQSTDEAKRILDEVRDSLEKDKNVQDRLRDDNYPSSEPLRIGKSRTVAYEFPISFRTLVPNTVSKYILLVVRPAIPQFIEPDIEHFEASIPAKSVEFLSTLCATWFAWASYEMDERQQYVKALRAGILPGHASIDEVRVRISRTLLRQIPFQEVVDLTEAGWRSLNYPANTPEFHSKRWDRYVLSKLDLYGPSNDCPWDEKNRPCRIDAIPDHDLHYQLGQLIKWRLLRPRDLLHLEPNSPVIDDSPEEGFTVLEGLLLRFNEKVKPGDLDSRTLGSFFASRFWEGYLTGDNRAEFWRANTTAASDKVECLAMCTRLSHYLLGGTPIDEATLNALMWAVSQYGHEVLGIEPRLDISSHLLLSARSDSGLRVLKPYYRDHFFHAIEVCFLGHLLLETTVGWRKTLADVCGHLMGRRSRTEVLREWYLAALFHDVGYAVEILRDVGKILEFFKRQSNLHGLSSGVEKILTDLSEAIVNEGFEGFLADHRPGEDHGVVAAQHLDGLIKHISKRKADMGQYEAAKRAIAFHNHHRRIVEFEKDPLAFLLIVCDTLQEWNRQHLRYATAPATILARLARGDSPEEALRLTGPLDRVATSIVRDGQGFKLEKPGELAFHLHYTDDINLDSGVFNLWIDSTSNLQRLRTSGLPFSIQITYDTPQFVRHCRPQRQMDRLKHAADETHMQFLHDWFPRTPCEDGATNGAITYRVQEAEGDVRRELLTLDVNELAKRQLITAGMDTFREKLAKWRGYNEDREFSGDYAPAVPG